MTISLLICAVAYLAPLPSPEIICAAAPELDRISQEQDVPWEVLLALGYHESRWTLDARNPKTGALGLFQQIPRWSPLGASDLVTLAGALDGLNHTLSWIRSFERSGGSVSAVLCTYGSGRAAWCARQGTRGSTYSRTVERLAGPLILLGRMLESQPETEHY